MTNESQGKLFVLPPNDSPQKPPEPKIPPLQNPVWTQNKAKLIERYLYYFTLVTKHGTYIDGFAGAQYPDKEDMWAAKLVLENEPRWLRHFHLYELESNKITSLKQLKDAQPCRGTDGRKINRNIEVTQGDFNVLISELLARNCIRPKEATFCLLDQRTFECEWKTVEALAQYKPRPENKIELFYFLAIGWLKRALHATKRTETIDKWWGNSNWRDFITMKDSAISQTFVDRFRNELDYKSVKQWPIFEKPYGGRIMYYMIHATDHPEAPMLMSRAYKRAVQPKETITQLSLLDLFQVPDTD